MGVSSEQCPLYGPIREIPGVDLVIKRKFEVEDAKLTVRHERLQLPSILRT